MVRLVDVRPVSVGAGGDCTGKSVVRVVGAVGHVNQSPEPTAFFARMRSWYPVECVSPVTVMPGAVPLCPASVHAPGVVPTTARYSTA